MSDGAAAARTAVGVVGAAGRMGTTVCTAIESTDDLALVARVGRGQTLADAAAAGAGVIVDFTAPDAVMATLTQAIALGLHAVVGTSGFDAARLDAVRELLRSSPDVGVMVVPNFALGAVLLTRFARAAAPYFESVEVVEMHHPDKLDAPSGTALSTAEAIAESRRAGGIPESPDASADVLPGARGVAIDGVRIHSVRLRGMLAHEEVLLGNVGEVLTLRHDTSSRDSFMPGVLMAIRAVGSRAGLTIGLEPLL